MAKIDDITIDVVTVENSEYNNQITEKTIESGSIISDHIFEEPITINGEFVIAGDDVEEKREALIEKRNKRDVVEYVDANRLWYYENMGIQSINFERDAEISNGYRGSFSLKQVRIVERPSITELGDDPITDLPAQEDEEDAENRTNQDEEVEEDEADKSFLKRMIE